MSSSHLLTVGTPMHCPHGGTVNAATRNTRVQAAGQMVLRSTDTFLVDGCKHTIGNVPHPCARVRWDVHAERHRSHGGPSLNEESVGLCLAGDGAMQGVVTIGSAQTRSAAT